jgi:hypothetical protein
MSASAIFFSFKSSLFHSAYNVDNQDVHKHMEIACYLAISTSTLCGDGKWSALKGRRNTEKGSSIS